MYYLMSNIYPAQNIFVSLLQKKQIKMLERVETCSSNNAIK